MACSAASYHQRPFFIEQSLKEQKGRRTLELNEKETIQTIKQALNGLKYGMLAITVHDSQIVQIDRTEKKRFPLKKVVEKEVDRTTGSPNSSYD